MDIPYETKEANPTKHNRSSYKLKKSHHIKSTIYTKTVGKKEI